MGSHGFLTVEKLKIYLQIRLEYTFNQMAHNTQKGNS